MQNDTLTIFVSTHITTDFDHVTGKVVLSHNGKVMLEILTEEMHERFHIIKGKSELLDADTRRLFIGIDETELGFTALFEGNPELLQEFDVITERVTLEDLMYFYIKRNDPYAAS